MSDYNEDLPAEEPSKKPSLLPMAIALTLISAVIVTIAVIITAATQTDPETRHRQELEKLQFSNIEVKNAQVAGGAEAWVSVGGCRLHLKRSLHDEEGWRPTGESVIAGIPSKPTADSIRNHPKFRECAKQPAPETPPS